MPHIDANYPATADDPDELIRCNRYRQYQVRCDGAVALFAAGMVTVCAIALHNVSGEMTIGATYASNDGVMGTAALILVVLIGLHNIPEEMAVFVPLISGGMSKLKAVLLAAPPGLPMVIGALRGFWFDETGPIF